MRILAGLVLLGTTLTLYAGEWQHGLSHYGELKYPADYEYFDYVNPRAPKGGKVSQAIIGTFNNLHPYIDKGRAAVCVNVACMLPYDMQIGRAHV